MANFAKMFQVPAGQNPRAGTRSGVRTPNMPRLAPLTGPKGTEPTPYRVTAPVQEESLQGVGQSLTEATQTAADLAAMKAMGPYAGGTPTVTPPTGAPGTGPYTGSGGSPNIDQILRTIRARESGSPEGNYTAKTSGWNPTTRTASGAYQFTKGTWNNYGGYTYAFQAPKAVQDERAIMDVRKFLAQGGIEAVPGMWFRPATYLNRSEWDTPIPGNNGLTMRAYIDGWMRAYNSYR